MGSIEDYRRRAQRASEASLGNMLHLRFAEIGAKPRENVALANLHTSLTKKKGQLREEEINQDYQRGQQLEEAYAPRPGPRNMNEEASRPGCRRAGTAGTPQQRWPSAGSKRRPLEPTYCQPDCRTYRDV